MDNTGFATFVYDAVNTPTGIGFNFTNPNGNFEEIDQILEVCCVDYAPDALRGVVNTTIPTTNNSKPINESFIKIYPNPNKGQQAIVEYKFKEKGKVSLSLYNINGQSLLQKTVHIPDASREVNSVINLYKLRLKPGMYLIQVQNGKENLNTKIIITN